MKTFGTHPPWFGAYRSKLINSYGVGIDDVGCIVDDETICRSHGYNLESMPAINARVSEDELRAVQHDLERTWKAAAVGAGSK